MGKYLIKLSRTAEKDLKQVKKSARNADINKISLFFEELATHPRTGAGKPEQLKYFDGEVWSREINKKDRLVYEIFEDEILIVVIQAKGHYADK